MYHLEKPVIKKYRSPISNQLNPLFLLPASHEYSVALRASSISSSESSCQIISQTFSITSLIASLSTSIPQTKIGVLLEFNSESKSKDSFKSMDKPQ